MNFGSQTLQATERRGKVAARRGCTKEVYDREESGIIVDMLGDKPLLLWLLCYDQLSVKHCMLQCWPLL